MLLIRHFKPEATLLYSHNVIVDWLNVSYAVIQFDFLQFLDF